LIRTSVLLLSVTLSVVVSGPLSASDVSAERQIGFGLKVAQKGLWGEAKFRFERAAKADPQSAAALNDLAVALEQMGDFAGARQAYEKALEIKPGDTYIQQNYDLFREADDKRNRKLKKQRAKGPQP
jgi:Flp pilus assembly protein TadD